MNSCINANSISSSLSSKACSGKKQKMLLDASLSQSASKNFSLHQPAKDGRWMEYPKLEKSCRLPRWPINWVSLVLVTLPVLAVVELGNESKASTIEVVRPVANELWNSE